MLDVRVLHSYTSSDETESYIRAHSLLVIARLVAYRIRQVLMTAGADWHTGVRLLNVMTDATRSE